MSRKSKIMLIVPAMCFVIAISTGVLFVNSLPTGNDITQNSTVFYTNNC